MGALFLNYFSTTSKKLVRSSSSMHEYWCYATASSSSSWKTQKSMSIVRCQSGGNHASSTGLSSVRSESSAPVRTMATANDHSTALVLPPNINTHDDQTLVKDLVSFVGPTTTLMESHDGIGILRFLNGKQFLITGATGFLAKILVEKILRTVPDVGKIYLMIKAKNKEAAMNRLKTEIINTELFKCLQQTHGKSYQAFMLSKLVPVVGNVCESNLGMETDLVQQISEEVDVIVNSAANTTFDERYDVALDINTQGPRRLMNFAKKCKKLKLFLQVSTAYVNGQREGKVMEKPFYMGDSIAREKLSPDTPPASLPVLDFEAELKLASDSKEACDECTVTQKMRELGLERAQLYGWQDTYVFTKAMGEMLLNSMRGDIPVVIMRPSVIESTLREPFPGWIEGIRMMDPIILSYGKGHLTGFLTDPKTVLDVIPADMVVNATMAAMAKHGAAQKPELHVYQVASSVVNPLSYQDLVRLFYDYFTSFPYKDSKGRSVHVSRMKLFSSMDDFSSHLQTDVVQRSREVASNGKLSKKDEYLFQKLTDQAKHLANIYEPYTFYGGRFDNTNTEMLMEDMSEEERRSFGFDAKSIDWKEYFSKIHIPGLRRHVMKGRGMY